MNKHKLMMCIIVMFSTICGISHQAFADDVDKRQMEGLNKLLELQCKYQPSLPECGHSAEEIIQDRMQAMQTALSMICAAQPDPAECKRKLNPPSASAEQQKEFWAHPMGTPQENAAKLRGPFPVTPETPQSWNPQTLGGSPRN